MRPQYFLLLVCLVSITSTLFEQRANAQQIRNYTTPGNLKITHDLDCIPLQNVKTTYTPADLFPAIRKCILQAKYNQAAEIYAIAWAYGHFDILRVTDRTAHQALKVLTINNLGNLESNAGKKFFQSVNAKSKNIEKLCKKIRNTGMPTYQPLYMASHGIMAFRTKPEKLIKTEFDAKSSWNTALSRSIKCP